MIFFIRSIIDITVFEVRQWSQDGIKRKVGKYNVLKKRIGS